MAPGATDLLACCYITTRRTQELGNDGIGRRSATHCSRRSALSRTLPRQRSARLLAAKFDASALTTRALLTKQQLEVVCHGTRGRLLLKPQPLDRSLPFSENDSHARTSELRSLVRRRVGTMTCRQKAYGKDLPGLAQLHRQWYT